MGVLGRWQLQPVHLDIVLKYLKIDGLTLPLSSRSFGYTADQFSQIAIGELDRMDAAGVVINDEVAPPLVTALKTLANPYLWVDSLWFPQVGSDHCWRALAVFTEGNRVVLGVQTPSEDPQRGGMLTVEVHENAPLPQVLLATLPPTKPGGQGPVRVPQSSLVRQPQPDDYDQMSVMQSATPSRGSSGDQQVALYEAIGKAPHARIGQMSASTRDQYGRRKRSQVVSWFDNEPDGRYLNRVERGSSGEQVFAILPAEARTIGAEIESLIAQVR
ncbi:ESX secretion-associated protein EspG [Saccharopolyspora sp. ASAGF58]|nr:ESX secretion-associated protein EspG [Saccharopolyspora sp. ASAGF58]